MIAYSAPCNVQSRKLNAVLNYKSLIEERRPAEVLLRTPETEPRHRRSLEIYRQVRKHVLKAKVMHVLDNHEGEWGQLQEAAEKDVDDPVIAVSALDVGRRYYREGKKEMAIPPLRLSVRVNPDLRQGYFYLTNCYRRLGRTPATKRAFRRLVRLRPDILKKLKQQEQP